VFGGFTPLEWESRKWNGKKGDESNGWKCDDSLTSFIFTLKNPHNIPARRFALRADKKQRAIWCGSSSGPLFAATITVSNNCNANTDSWTELGRACTNDTV
jgi:hypothetical protein